MCRIPVIALAVCGAVLAFACSGRSETGREAGACERSASTCPSSARDFLARVAASMSDAGTYELSVQQENLVLPRWGGSDGGSVAVNLRSGDAGADLQRTGDGRYVIVLQAGETYFKRVTCRQWTRMRDAEDVLAPFVLTADEITGAKVFELNADQTPIRAEIEIQGVGRATLLVDPESHRPLRLRSDTATKNGKTLEWVLYGWGQRLAESSVSAVRVGGPGGNPC